MNEAAAVLDAVDDLAADWAGERTERLARQHLERADFDALIDTGYLRLMVPVDHGGLWTSLAETGPVIVDAVGRLARGDHSVALVASMHPAVMIAWTAIADAPEEQAAAWAEQRARVFASATDGHMWGTITSEPGSGGDVMRTKAIARPTDDGGYTLHGAKHFGSGSGMSSFMITTARVEALDLVLPFFIDLRDNPWDGTAGIEITRPWDGMGMKATQSHAAMLDGIRGEVFAWPGALSAVGPTLNALGLTMFCAVVATVVDQAMAETDRRLTGRELRPYEDVTWTEAQVGHWMLTQALKGLVDELATKPPTEVAVSAIKAKTGMADLAETVLRNASRAVGGGAFAASSPYASWFEDVRALGYLRPPWALAFDQLSAARQAD